MNGLGATHPFIGLLILDRFILWGSYLLFLAQAPDKEIQDWDRNSYLIHVISPPKEIFHVNSVCIGYIGRHAT